jgi:hypothetical protein
MFTAQMLWLIKLSCLLVLLVFIYLMYFGLFYRLCGLVVRGPGSIPGATRFSEK